MYKLKISPYCNNNCIYCNHLEIKNNYNKSTEEIINEISSLNKKKINTIILPCNFDIRVDAKLILKKIKELGFKIILETNGSIFYYKNYINELKKYINKFIFYINGPEKIHNIITNNNSYIYAIQGLRNLININKDIKIKTILFNNNKNNEYLNDLKNILKILNINEQEEIIIPVYNKNLENKINEKYNYNESNIKIKKDYYVKNPIIIKENTIVFLRNEFLIKTENLIFNEINSIKSFNPMVITLKKTDYMKDIIPTIEVSESDNKSLELISYLTNKNIKIIHAQFGYEGKRFLLLKKQLNIPLITSFRGFDIYRLTENKIDYYKELFLYGDLFLTRSRQMKEDLIKIRCPKEKIIIHHTGIEINKFKYKKRIKKRKIKLLTVGRFVEKKGIIYLLNAFNKIKNEYKNISLTIVGKESRSEDKIIKNEILNYINHNKLNNNIILKDVNPYINMEKIYLSHQIYIQSSITASNGDKEGIPNALKEAMLTGMPVISTYHSGIPELIDNGENGILINEKDIYGLYLAIKYIIETPEKWFEYGVKAREKIIKEHNLEIQTNKLENIYKSILNKQR